MGLKQVLHKLKLVELDDAPAPVPAAPQPARGAARARPMEEILAAVEPAPEIDERKLAASGSKGAGTSIPLPSFSEVYAAAGIQEPAHGFSAFKVLEMLQASEFASLEPKAKAAALLGFLKMNPRGPVAIADVVQDAVRRDQALDKFEQFVRAKLTERRAALEAENKTLQSEIDDLARRNQARMESNRKALDDERARLDEWLEKKGAEEKRLAAAVEPFVEGSPIST